ncbi:MAG: response regulator [Firmicutes bacterium]|nr:response regulator [Bacillota bacterium]
MYKVLLVDDETINYQLFEKLVNWKEKGFAIAGFAADGQEAIQKYEEIDPDLIFMDIQLPFMDGLECVRCIREVDKNVKIVIVSAYGEFSYAQRAIRYGVQDFLLKPVSRIMLNQLVDKMKHDLDEKERKQEQNLFNNIWVDEMMKIMQGVSNTGDLAKYGIPFTFLGITLVDTDGYLIPGFTAKLHMEKILKISKEQEKILGIAVHSEGYIILAVKQSENDSFSLDSITTYFSSQEDCKYQIYIQKNAFEVSDVWVNQFMTCENYGFYHEKGAVYDLDEFSFSMNAIHMDHMDRVIQESMVENSAEKIFQYMKKVFADAKRYQIYPGILKEAVLDFLVRVKFILRKYEKNESFPLMRNIRLENIQSIQDAEGLERFFENKIKRTFEDINQCFFQSGKNIVFRSNAYAELNYCDSSFSVQNMADYLGLSKNYFTSLYKEQSGTGFWDHITELRMKKAMELLLSTDELISNVGKMAGYESEYHFSRKFKDYTGESPKEYRKNRRN